MQNFTSGVMLELTLNQAKRRKHILKEIEKGIYLTLAPVMFKAGDVAKLILKDSDTSKLVLEEMKAEEEREKEEKEKAEEKKDLSVQGIKELTKKELRELGRKEYGLELDLGLTKKIMLDKLARYLT